MVKLSKIGSKSKTDQIVMVLKQAFLDGEYHGGDQLPAVTALAEQFGVSVSSVREALQKLEALDLVEIVHGKGVFVRSAQMQWQARFTSFSETVRRWGKVPGAKLLTAQVLPATSLVAAQLAISEGAETYFIKRLRLADNEPIAIEGSYLSAERFPGLLQLYQDPMSLYQLLQKEYGVRLAAGLQTLEAVILSAKESQVLATLPGAPALKVDTIAYEAESSPVEYGFSLFRGDKYRYVVWLNR